MRVRRRWGWRVVPEKKGRRKGLFKEIALKEMDSDRATQESARANDMMETLRATDCFHNTRSLQPIK